MGRFCLTPIYWGSCEFPGAYRRKVMHPRARRWQASLHLPRLGMAKETLPWEKGLEPSGRSPGRGTSYSSSRAHRQDLGPWACSLLAEQEASPKSSSTGTCEPCTPGGLIGHRILGTVGRNQELTIWGLEKWSGHPSIGKNLTLVTTGVLLGVSRGWRGIITEGHQTHDWPVSIGIAKHTSIEHFLFANKTCLGNGDQGASFGLSYQVISPESGGLWVGWQPAQDVWYIHNRGEYQNSFFLSTFDTTAVPLTMSGQPLNFHFLRNFSLGMTVRIHHQALPLERYSIQNTRVRLRRPSNLPFWF